MENQLVDAMSSLTLLRTVFGMAPFFLHKRIWISYVTASIVLVLYTIAFYYLLREEGGIHTGKLNYVTEMAIYVRAISYYLITFVIVIAEYWNIKKMIAVLSIIEEVDGDFTTNFDLFHVKVDYNQSKRILQKAIKLLVATCIIGTLLYVYLIFNLIFKDIAFLVALITTNFLPPTIMAIMIIQYCFCLGLIRKRFGWINHQLTQFNEKSLILHNDINMISSQSCEIQLKIIQVSCWIYSKLVETCGLLNSAHNAQVVLYFASSFIVAVTQVYSVLVTDVGVSSDAAPVLYIGITGTCCHTFGIIIMSLNCHKVASEAANTGVLLHKVKNKTNSMIKEEIEIWSLQIMHEKVEFSACGFFVIDMTLVYSVIGSITTYLVILIQFSAASKSNSSSKSST